MLNQYTLYSIQNNPESSVVDEFEQFYNKYDSFEDINKMIDFLNERFPNIENTATQTLEFKGSNKKIVCNRTNKVYRLIAYAGDKMIKEKERALASL